MERKGSKRREEEVRRKGGKGKGLREGERKGRGREEGEVDIA